MDSNVAAKYDVPLWNETRWNGCWNPAAGVGLYLHAGRFRHDLDLWWAQVVAYLPDRRLCVQRLWGHNESDAGVRLGGLDLAMREGGWTATFDGVGELTTIEDLAGAPRGSSAPNRRMRFEVTATPLTPVWDMYRSSAEGMQFAGDFHIQQANRSTGSLQVADETYALDGIGFKDHSHGLRDLSNYSAHILLNIIGEDFHCLAMTLFGIDGEPHGPWGALLRDGKEERVTRFTLPVLEDSAGGPIRGEVVIEIESGEMLRFDSELIHALPMTITLDNDNINGVDWEIGGDPIVLIEGKGRLTAPDGSVVYCFHERSARRSLVVRA
jgi:hypothetical protein